MNKLWRVYIQSKPGQLQHFYSDVVLPSYNSYETAVEDLKAHMQIKREILHSGLYEFVIQPSLMLQVI